MELSAAGGDRKDREKVILVEEAGSDPLHLQPQEVPPTPLETVTIISNGHKPREKRRGPDALDAGVHRYSAGVARRPRSRSHDQAARTLGCGTNSKVKVKRNSLPSSTPVFPVPVPIAVLDGLDLHMNRSTRLERRRQQALLIAILDLLTALGLLTYHIDRALSYYNPHPVPQPVEASPSSPPSNTRNYSAAAAAMWCAVFFHVLLHITGASILLASSFSARCIVLDHSPGHLRTAYKCAHWWIIIAVVLLSFWSAKLIMYACWGARGYKFPILMEEHSSIWFVILLYSGLILSRGIGIFFVRKYMRELH